MPDSSCSLFSSYVCPVIYSVTPRYPHALHHLELLQNERFRLGLSEDGLRDYLNQTQFDHWRTWFVHLLGVYLFSQSLSAI